MNLPPSRRSFLKVAGLLGSATLLPRVTSAAAPSPAFSGIKLGIASYSLRKLSREDAIAAVQTLGTPYINLKSFHLPYELSTTALTAGRRQFEAAGLQIVGGGTVYMKDDAAELRKSFEYAHTAGMPLMVAAPAPAALPKINALVKEFDIKVAIHNHGPEDKNYPAPSDALKLIAHLDPRMGVCLDIGHTIRAGKDPVAEAALAGDRLLDVHLKDLTDFSDRDSQVEVGAGNIPIAPFLRQLENMRYAGYVNLEYEIDAEAPLPGMRRSMAHLRGILAGLDA